MKDRKIFSGIVLLSLIIGIILFGCGCSKGYDTDEEGNIHITESGTTLSNMDIDGDLYIDESVGDGEFTLEDINISGTLHINGGGSNSGYLINVTGTDMTVESKDGTRVVCTNTSMDGVQLLADCIIESDGSDIKNISVGSSDTADAIEVLLKGEYPDVTIESTANVTIDGKVSLMTVLEKAGMTSIEMVDDSKCYFYSCYGQSVTVTGGTIIEAWINAEYCSLPENTNAFGSNTGIANVKVGEVDYDIPVWTDQDQVETSDDSDVAISFVEGYPKISKDGSVITILSSCNSPCTIYACVEGDDVGLEGMSPDEIINPAAHNDNPDYIPITGSVSASMANEVYTISINLASFFPDDMDMMGPQGNGFAVFVIAESLDGGYSNAYRIVVK